MIATTSVDPHEVARFSAQARAWWDPQGEFAALHRLNPVRLGFIREHMLARFGADGHSATPFKGLAVLDIGCGGGLLTEPMARLGASVTGIDPSDETIASAQIHAEQSGLEINYRATSAEDLLASGAQFDVVLAMEVIEHVADIGLFIKATTSLARPGGLVFAATINRTLKSFALAIVGAEYILRWVPRGTHSWEKFVTPAEIESALGDNGLGIIATSGVIYNPLAGGWRRGRDLDVNYMLVAGAGGAAPA